MTHIYTAIFGGIDDLLIPDFIRGVNFSCYTDRKDFQLSVHQIIDKKSSDNPWLESRKYKLLSHNYHQGPNLWVDGCVKVNSSVTKFLEEHSTSEFAVFKHPYSNSIEEEAERCLENGKLSDRAKVEQQLKTYNDEGFKSNYLLAGGIIFRKNTPLVKSINELWWQEINKHQTRDEIALPYVLWKHNFKAHIIDEDIFNNPYFSFKEHLRTRP